MMRIAAGESTRARRRRDRRWSRKIVDSLSSSGRGVRHGARRRGQRPKRRLTGARSDRAANSGSRHHARSERDRRRELEGRARPRRTRRRGRAIRRIGLRACARVGRRFEIEVKFVPLKVTRGREGPSRGERRSRRRARGERDSRRRLWQHALLRRGRRLGRVIRRLGMRVWT